VAWFQAVRGRRHSTAPVKPELKPAAGSSNEKEANHGNEEEKEEDGEAGSSRKVTMHAAPLIWPALLYFVTAAGLKSGRYCFCGTRLEKISVRPIFFRPF
jgi:hypothetical protein